MTRPRPTIAGRSVPLWTGFAIRLLCTIGLIGIASQVADVEASSATPGSPGPRLELSDLTPLLDVQPAADPAVMQTAIGPVRRLVIGRQMLHGDYVWNDEGVPAGRIQILVDLSAQTLSVVRNGQEIGRAVILYGTDENPTPTGTFPIMEKDADHVSNLYEARMPFMMRLTRDGVAIHGSNVRYGWASRGCVGVPVEFAELLFAQARVGDRVTIVRGAATPAA
jgi:L,D-transpeptidase-like protein